VGLAVDEPIVEVVEKLKNRGVVFQGPIRDDGGLMLAASPAAGRLTHFRLTSVPSRNLSFGPLRGLGCTHQTAV
jgi:hypothetical protein